MSEYIKREDIEKAIADIRGAYRKARNFNAVSAMDNAAGEIRECVKNADVASVAHGEWHYNENGRDFGLGAWACSCCGTCNHNIPGNPNMNPYIWSGSKFCPNCGAKMDGGKA